ncbi:MAG: DegV family protein, partial [Clostridia bacterium]|nr:DegV family protein [Clostridia bacterium]
MANYILSCCSTVDLTEEHLNSRDIKYICFHYTLDGVQYPDDLGKSMAFPDFYKAMTNGAETKTSQVNKEDFAVYFTELLNNNPGKDVLHISFSSGLSGSCGSAMVAATEVNQAFPDRKVIVVDSLAASSGYGLLMDKCADLRDEGMDIDTLAKWVEDNRLNLHHWFFSTDLTFYIKGGRVSKTSGFVAGILGICPLLNVNEEGKLIPREKILSKKKVKEAIVKKMEKYVQNGFDYNDKVYICQSACLKDAEDVKDLVKANFKNIKGDVVINDIGTVIGSQTGPGTVALFFWGNKRNEL